MNIPSIESLLAELDKYKRAYESAERQILSLKEQRNRLTAERDEAVARNTPLKALIRSLEDQKSHLRKQRNRWNEAVKTLDSERQANARLTAERDAALAENAAYYQLAKKEVWAVAEAALREAKEALVMNIVGTSGRTPAAHNAIATINKVLL